MAPRVLLVSSTKDAPTTGLVKNALEAAGAQTLLLNTDEYPTAVAVSSALEAEAFTATLKQTGETQALNDLTAVWYRRLHAGQQLPGEMEGPFRQAAIEESRRSLIGLLATLPCFALDPFETVRRAVNKPYQLALAQAVGMKTPRTIITNDPETARRFIDSCPEGAVAKLQSAVGIPLENGLNAVPTTRIQPDHLAGLAALSLCPMMFQNRIEKKLELRIAAVGRQLFAAAIDPSKLPNGEDDWRCDAEAAISHWVPFTLPNHIAEQS